MILFWNGLFLRTVCTGLEVAFLSCLHQREFCYMVRLPKTPSNVRNCDFFVAGGYCKEYTKGSRPVGVMLDDTWFLR